MRNREQGLLRVLDLLCVQWKSLELLLLRLAGSQADHAKCAHQSPGALEELPSPPPLMCSHSLSLPIWSIWTGHRVQHWECCWGPLWDWGQRLPAHGQGEAEPRSASTHLLRLLRAVFELHS